MPWPRPSSDPVSLDPELDGAGADELGAADDTGAWFVGAAEKGTGSELGATNEETWAAGSEEGEEEMAARIEDVVVAEALPVDEDGD